MGIFEFVLALVIIATAGKIAERRFSQPRRDQSLQAGTDELHRLRETMTDLSGRLEHLEQERDFYKDLLEPKADRRELPPADTGD